MDPRLIQEKDEDLVEVGKNKRDYENHKSVDYGAFQSQDEYAGVVSNKYDRRAAYNDEQWEHVEFVDKGEKYESFVDSLVISILTITAIANSAYAIIAPFLPFEFKRKEIDQSWIGYIFSIYSVAVIFCSPLVGRMMPIFGRRNLVTFGMFLMGSSFLSFGLISEIE